jgi:hypothetical protein
VNISDGVETIYESAFEGCAGLKSLTLPSSVSSIRHNAFKDCKGLTDVTILNKNPEIYSQAFGGCTLLANVSMSIDPEKIPFLLMAFQNTPYSAVLNKMKFEAEAAKRKQNWQMQGKCGNCGGKLGLFKKCKNCGHSNK